MDAIIAFLIGFALIYKIQKKEEVIEEHVTPQVKLPTKMNPQFIKDENAFMDLYDCIMKRGK